MLSNAHFYHQGYQNKQKLKALVIELSHWKINIGLGDGMA